MGVDTGTGRFRIMEADNGFFLRLDTEIGRTWVLIKHTAEDQRVTFTWRPVADELPKLNRPHARGGEPSPEGEQ